MRKSLLVGAVTVALLIIIFTDRGFGQRNNWKHFSDSQFPSYVTEIDFEGASLTPNMNVTFGSWTVRFINTSLPIIVGYNGNSVYTIYNLMAHNDVAGDFPCIIYYIDGANLAAMRRGQHDYQWNLGVLQEFWNPSYRVSESNHPNYNRIVSLPFPVTIQLKQ